MYLGSDDRVYLIPAGTVIQTTEGPIKASETMVVGYKGHLFADDVAANEEALNNAAK